VRVKVNGDVMLLGAWFLTMREGVVFTCAVYHKMPQTEL